jgi:hypothetical protein
MATKRVVRRRQYWDYITSPEWKTNRARIRAVQQPQFCYCCGNAGVALELHHRSYKSLGREISRHMCFVCRGCHQAIHDYAKQHRTDLWRATKKIRRQRGGLTAARKTRKIVQSLPTLDELNSGRYTKHRLAQWGIGWPPQKGWKRALEKRIRYGGL